MSATKPQDTARPNALGGAAAITPAPERRRGRKEALLREWLPLTALYFVLGCYLTWPLVKRMSTGMYGFGNDNFGGMFTVEWVYRAFWGPEKTGFAPELQAPFGFEIDERYISPYDRIISIVFGGIGDGLFAYNIEVLISFVAAGLTMYALARYLTGNRAAAIVAGVIFAASPFHLAMAMQYPAFASIQWAPLVVLTLIRALRTRTKRDAAWFGVSIALMWATNFYYGWFAIWWVAAMLATIGLIGLVRAARAKRAWNAVRETGGFLVTRGSVAVGVCLLITIPMLFSLITNVVSEPGKYARGEQDLIINSVRPWQFIIPPQDHPVWGDRTADVINRHTGLLPVYEQNVYLGLVPVLLALLCVVFRRRLLEVARGAIVPMLAASAFFVLLMLGPAIPYEVTSIGDWLSPSRNPHWDGPSNLLFEISPNFRYYGRAFVFISVALAALAAMGLAAAIGRYGKRWPKWGPYAAAGVLSLLVVFEFANRPPSRFVDLSEPAWVDAVQDLPADASIVNYPVAGYSTPRSLFYTYWQTRHDHATANPPETPESQEFLRSVDDPDSFLAGRKLAEAGIDYAVVHTKLPPATFPPYQPSFPDDSLPPNAGRRNPWFTPVARTDDAVIYKLREKPTEITGAVVGYGAGWGEPEPEPGGPWRWMLNGDSKLTAFAAKDYRRARLQFTITSFNVPRKFDLALDGKRIHRMVVPSDRAVRVDIPISLSKGAHEMQIITDPGPVEVDSVLHNGDLRALAVRIQVPRVVVPGEK